jgi:sugar (pentulose or hexulose) kinase
MDKADGSGTMLFDLRERTWSSQILDQLNISPDSATANIRRS